MNWLKRLFVRPVRDVNALPWCVLSYGQASAAAENLRYAANAYERDAAEAQDESVRRVCGQYARACRALAMELRA